MGQLDGVGGSGVVVVEGACGVSGAGGASTPVLSGLTLSSESLSPVSNKMVREGWVSSWNNSFHTMKIL